MASLPALANVGRRQFLHLIQAHALWAQLAGIVVVYVWNYAASSRLSGTTPKPTWLPIAMGSLLRLVQIWMPVVGVHSWRQADTAMARHFAEQGTPIWLPQIDWVGASAGLLSRIPIYPFLVSRLYGLIGVQNGWVAVCRCSAAH